MADNVTADAGAGGATFRTDDDGTAHWPYTKLAFGADDTQTIVGSTSSNPLPVALSDTDNAVLDTIDAVLDAINAKLVTGTVIGAVEISDTSFAVADGNALGEGVLIQGDDGTDRKNINVDATTGDVQVDVTNTVTVDLGANNDVTLATLPDTAAGDLAAINAALGGTLTVGSHAVTNAGTFATQVDGDALTALQLIDNIVLAEDAVHNTGDSGVMSLAVRNDTLAALAGTDGDYAPLQVNASGALFIQEGSALDVSAATVTVDGSGVTQPVSAASLPLPTGAATAAKQPALGTAGTASTDVISVQGIASMTALVVDGSGVTQPVSGTVTANLSATDNAVLDNIQTAVELIDNAINGSEMQVDVVGALPAGSNLIGDVGIQGRTTGGLSIYYDNDLDETAIAVKASAGTLYGMHVINTTAAPLYLQLFNVAQGSVTVGTTTPTVQFVVPANADSDGAGFTFNLPQGIAFGTAITAACSTGSETNGAPGANACHCNLFYK